MENVPETATAVNAVIAQSTFSTTSGTNKSIRSYKSCMLNRQEYTENNVKVSDSGYSNSCSNSQSRRSYSSKSMLSGSLSSGSSGYCGKPSPVPVYSHSIHLSEKRMKERDMKKKKKMQIVSKVKKDKYVVIQSLPELEPVQEIQTEYGNNAILSSPPLIEVEQKTIIMDISTSLQCSVKKEVVQSTSTMVSTLNCVTHTERRLEGFSCVISMHDGIVMYTTASITAALGFPKDMWVGRSFIDFVHPRDRNTFASQITNGLTIPKSSNVAAQTGAAGSQTSTMVCRIRRYRGLQTGYRTKEKLITHMPFLLNFFFKNVAHDECNVVYLVVQATPYSSAFKTPNEIIANAKSFIIRHSASGSLEFIDIESVPYLGYLPQDILKKNALQLYHHADLGYLRNIYESIVKEGIVERSKPYRMITQNGDYLKLETEWSSFINPWSRKLEFVTGKHFVIEGPRNPDVFQTFKIEKAEKISEEEHKTAQLLRQNITRIMNEVPTKPAQAVKLQIGKRCQDLASYMETLLENPPKNNNTELKIEIHDTDTNNLNDQDSVMMVGMSPHYDFSDTFSAETILSYNQLNFNDTLQRYFDCYEPPEEVDDKKLSIKEAGETDSNCMSGVEEEPQVTDEPTRYGMNSLVVPEHIHPLGNYETFRLTESVLIKHNADMEQELIRRHRENRLNKTEREKIANDMKQKKKEHLARCNAFIVHTIIDNAEQKQQGVKRTSKQKEEGSAHKHRCSSARLIRHKQITRVSHNSQPASSMDVIPMLYTPAPIHHASIAPPEYHFNLSSSHMQGLMGHHASRMGSHYEGHMNTKCSSSSTSYRSSPYVSTPYEPRQMPYMMFGQAVYTSPFMYSSIDPQIYTLQQSFVPQSVPNMPLLENANQNYEEKKRSIMASRNKRKLKMGKSDESKTDEESSYSSLYSSFFKTDSGSNEESDGKNFKNDKDFEKLNGEIKKNNSRKTIEPPWMHQVRVTSELIYKYQICAKDKEEVLICDKEKLDKLEQPTMVNEQLGQLYLDLQLQGVATKLTLEEGITSSSSSGEETCVTTTTKIRRRKREYSKLVMIYEEDAPLPSADEEEAA